MARIFLDPRDLDDELRRVFDRLPDGDRAAAEFTPAVDVVETVDGVVLLMDLPGVAADSLKVLFVRNTLVIIGQKRPTACEHRAAFHIAERVFGRFARAVRLGGAFDAGRADATLKAGELRVLLPRIEERRGGELRIHVRIE